ncbi:MAG TPA: nitroreductase family deazaflavin-dependent oxidoreductase [Actinospica sp.]|jgi:deazaflavin-dependent oxidoreductase (nitroreductase family)|nr:nitroreductase family deazaflavin-dependent oxidoreductase [Actinospica sp.]
MSSGTAYDEGAVVDSPTEWVNSHIQQYVASDGAEGHDRNGAPTLLLSVLGRKSGVWRRHALIYGQAGDAYVVVASKGGAAQHPAWYVNLVAEPAVHVQVKDAKFEARARVAEGEERARLWRVMAEIWPDYDVYQTKTEREIPIVVLEPVQK